jgi:hypothetical protein
MDDYEQPLKDDYDDDDDAPPPPRVPGQKQMLLLSVIFVFASVFLLMEFIVLHQAGQGSPIKYVDGKTLGAPINGIGTDSVWWRKTDPKDPTSGCPANCPKTAVNLINWLGLFSCVGWFAGFALLLDWTVNPLRIAFFPGEIASRINLTGVVLKLIASVLFNVQPWAAIINPDDFGFAGLGVEWSNFSGICFFHVGNCINAVDMITGPLMNWKDPFCKANWPILGMQVYCLATWFLVIADGFAYWHLRCDLNPLVDPINAKGTGLLGYTDPSSWVCPSEANMAFVSPGQIIGSTLLLVGSIIYTAYSID